MLAEEVTRRTGNDIQVDVHAEEHDHEALWGDCIKSTFLRMDCEVGSGDTTTTTTTTTPATLSTSWDHIGSTAIIAVLSCHHVIVGNCGDSRAVLCRRRQPIPLSEDHKVSFLSFSLSLSLTHTIK